MIITNGTRVAYFSRTKQVYVCISTLHDKIELITKEQYEAEYYVEQGLNQWYNRIGGPNAQRTFAIRADSQLYQQWKNKMKGMFPDAVVY